MYRTDTFFYDGTSFGKGAPSIASFNGGPTKPFLKVTVDTASKKFYVMGKKDVNGPFLPMKFSTPSKTFLWNSASPEDNLIELQLRSFKLFGQDQKVRGYWGDARIIPCN